MDPLSEPRRVGDRLADVTAHRREQLLRRRRVVLDRLRRELQLDSEGDEVLLDDRVQLTLEVAALGVGGEHEPLTGGMQLRELVTHRLGVSFSHASEFCVIAPAPSRSSTPNTRPSHPMYSPGDMSGCSGAHHERR
jgi:hypothetical protein